MNGNLRLKLTICTLTAILILAACVRTSPIRSVEREDFPFRAGVAKTAITPSYDMWMAGYAARDKPSNGKFHDLYAKALALEDQAGNRVVLVTADLIGFPADFAARVASRIEKTCGLPRESVMLTASHTHSGPLLERRSYYSKANPETVARYREELEEKLIEVVADSLKNLEEAFLERGVGCADFAVNRREYTLDGVTIGVNPVGPVDHDVPVLKVSGRDGALRAIVFGYACHNTTLSLYKFCGDYAGYAQIEVEKRYPDAVAMFFMGCGGDANPNPRRSVELAQSHGRALSQAVMEALEGPLIDVSGPIAPGYREIDLPLSPAPTRQEIEERVKSETGIMQTNAKLLLERLDREGRLEETYPYPIQIWSFGEDFDWIALAGEVVTDYSLRLKHELGRERVWVTAYANKAFGYIPSLRVLREGGYEADRSMYYAGFHGPWAPQVEQDIIAAVHELVAANRPGPRSGRSVRAARDLDQMISELGLHRSLNRAHFRTEYDFVELPNHLPRPKLAEFTALRSRRAF